MAKHRLDKIIVIDVECTCWEGRAPIQDIIEIGNAIVDTRTEEIIRGTSILVVPTQTEVSQFCTDLTGHTAGELNEYGFSFSEAIVSLRNLYKTDKYLWASWGDFDRRMFTEQCRREGVRYPFGPTHFNIKALYGLWTGSRRQCSVEVAIKERGWEFEGRPHNGQDDTNNIARLLQWLLKNRSTL